jgi:hypothetical protein
LANAQTNHALSKLFADKDGQIVLEQFVWAVAKPKLKKLISPIAAGLCVACKESLSLPSNGKPEKISMTLNREDASSILGKIMKQGHMNDIHIRFPEILLKD